MKKFILFIAILSSCIVITTMAQSRLTLSNKLNVDITVNFCKNGACDKSTPKDFFIMKKPQDLSMYTMRQI
jgi:hypothetical protein